MRDVRQGFLFVVSGPSGAGKGAICAGLAAETKIMLSVSMTTRSPRANEVEGKSYYFVDRTKFEETIAEAGFFEYAEIFGEYYGTPVAPVLKQLDKGMDVILEIDVNGAMQVREKIPDAVLIFIMPPSMEELRRRIEGRGTETPENIAYRLQHANSEIGQIMKYDYCVVNDKLDKAIRDVGTIIKAERMLEKSREAMLTEMDDMKTIRQAAKMGVATCAEGIVKRYQSYGYKQKK